MEGERGVIRSIAGDPVFWDIQGDQMEDESGVI